MIKHLLFNLIAFIIAASSLQVAFSLEINFSDEGHDVISSSPLINLAALRSPNGKNSQDVEISHENFVELAIFNIVSSLPTIPFLYYLPIYSLKRVKDFFLLI